MSRIGSDYNLLLARRFLDRINQAYTDSMEPLATGRRINHPSDDPARMTEYFQNVNMLTQIEQYRLNISNSRMRVEITDSTLNEMTELMNEVYEIALQGNDQTNTGDQQTILTDRLTALKDNLVDAANTKIGGVYIFSGYLSTTQPFTGTPIAYNGDSNAIMAKVSQTKEVQINIDADEIFMGGGTGVDIFATVDDLITSIQAQDEIAIGTLVTDIQAGIEQLVKGRTQMGNAIKTLDTAETNLQYRQQQVTERLSALVDVDMAKATTDLSFNELTLKSSLEVTKRVLSISLQSFFD